MPSAVLRLFLCALFLTAAGFLALQRAEPAGATPLYAVRSAHACDTCHVEPVDWAEGALPDRRCTLDCNACHVSPTGTGMRTPAGNFYARQVLPAAGRRPAPGPGSGQKASFSIFRGFSGWEPGELSMAEVEDPYGTLERDPRFDWGLDFRGTGFFPLEASDRDRAVFPMQADFYLMARPLSHLVLYSNAGLMGDQDRTYDHLSNRTGFQQLVAAREVFVMADRLPYNSYLRAGRFAPPYGLRIPDHTSFIRRELGFDQDRQVFGVEAGTNPNYPFLNVAGFYQGWDAWPGDVEDEGAGFSATAGYRDLAAQIGASLHGLDRFHDPDGLDRELTYGLFWGVNLYPLVYLGEVDQRRRFLEHGAGDYTSRFVYQELNWLLARGYSALVKYDWFDLDTDAGDDQYHRGTLGAQWNPYTAIQVDIQYRKTWIPEETDEQDILLLFHAYL